MKKLFIPAFAFFVAFVAISWTNKLFRNIVNITKYDSQPVLMQTKSFNIGNIQNVNASTTLGSITVTGDAAGEASVEMYAQANNDANLSKDEIQQIINRDYDIEITTANGTLTAKAIAKHKSWSNGEKHVSISFKIHTAKNVSTDLSSVTGNIYLASLHGSQHFETSTGSLHLENISGNVDGHSSTGDVYASNCMGNIRTEVSTGSMDLKSLNGNIHAHTSTGHIRAQNITGTLDAETSTGNIKLNNIAAKVNASASTGSIVADFDSFKNDATLSTSLGHVTVSVPQGIAANLDLEGSHINTNKLYNFSGESNKKNIKGSINGGGATLVASTDMGSVDLNFK